MSSLLAYSNNIKLTTAGHLSKSNLTGKTSKSARAHALIKAFGEHSSDYIFQDEIFSFDELIDKEDIYDDSTHRINRKEIGRYYDSNIGAKVNFSGYYFFSDPSSWRQYMASRDLFLGDRFHGGVAALQVGVPAIMIRGDLRVTELTDFFGIPGVDFKQMRESGLPSVVNENCSDERLSSFKEVYSHRLKQFKEVCSEAGLLFS